MFTLKKTLLFASLCGALTVPSQASNTPDEEVATNSTSLAAAPAATITWDPAKTAAAREDNKTNPLLTLHQLAYQEIMTDLFAEGDIKGLSSLLTTCHKLHDQLLHTAVHAAFRGVLKTRAKMLEPWAALLFHKDAKMQHLIWARQMLRPENIERLGEMGLLEQLTKMSDKAKALALGAYATEIFTDGMAKYTQSCIIIAADQSSRPVSEYPAVAAACRAHLFTDKMDRYAQAWIINTALKSSCPLSEYATRVAACKEHLFTQWMKGVYQADIIQAALNSSCPLSEYASLKAACREHFFMEGMYESGQTKIIQAALASSRPLSDFAALGVACKDLFTEGMNWGFQRCIIEAALESSRPLSDFAALGAGCKHLLTEKMQHHHHAQIIKAALESSCPLSEYAALGVACKNHLFTRGMDEDYQIQIIQAVLPLSDAQRAQLVREYGERFLGIDQYRMEFIRKKAKELLAEK